MIRTRVGYAGGTTPYPTYNNIGDYSETVQVDYDPAAISYEELLQAFWNGHDASAPLYSRQYASVIFFHNEEQKAAALKSKVEEETRTGQKMITDIIPYAGFYIAEDYHQKYGLQSSSFISEMRAIYPDMADLVNSTAAARLNGYLSGYGDTAIARAQLDQYGLSEEGKKELLKILE